MNLTTKGRYAVMAMVDMGMHQRGEPLALAVISERQGIALNYLEQIFAKLRKAGLVQSVRGPGGGYVLCSELHQITISDIVLAVEESIKMTRCKVNDVERGCMHDKSRCMTHDLWDGLSQHIFMYLHSVTLAQVCNKEINRFMPLAVTGSFLSHATLGDEGRKQ